MSERTERWREIGKSIPRAIPAGPVCGETPLEVLDRVYAGFNLDELVGVAPPRPTWFDR